MANEIPHRTLRTVSKAILGPVGNEPEQRARDAEPYRLRTCYHFWRINLIQLLGLAPVFQDDPSPTPSDDPRR